MNPIIYFFLALSFALTSSAQTYKTVTVIEQRNQYLHAGISSTTFGSNSRAVIRIDLPPNTKKWYYSFTTTANTSGSKILNLGIQLAAAYTTGGASILTSPAINVPPGSGAVDVYVFSPDYRNAFLKKDDRNWKYFADFSVIGSNHAVQTVDAKYGNSFYLGLKNPSSLNGVNIVIEVVAIVEEVETTNGWTKEQKEHLFKTVKSSFNANGVNSVITDTQEDAFLECLLKKFTTQYTPQQVSAYADYERKEIMLNLGKQCDSSLNLNLDEKITDAEHVRQNLVGKWKNENSTFVLHSNGAFFTSLGNEKSVSGKWEIKDGLLKMKANNAQTSKDYYILEINNTKLTYQLKDSSKDQTIYHATKIAQE